MTRPSEKSATRSVPRRMVLKGAMGATLALPFLPSLLAEGRAAPVAPAKRFIYVFTANGQRPENWYPSAARSWKTLDASQHVRESSLSDLSAGKDPFSRIIGTEFAPVAEKLLVLRGLDHVQYNAGAGHVSDCSLNATRRAVDDPLLVTIDQRMAVSKAVYPVTPQVRSHHMLVKPGYQSGTSCSISDQSGTAQFVPHETSLLASYQRLFGSFVDPEDDGAQARIKSRLRTLDAVRAQYKKLLEHPRLSSDDRRRLDAHASFISDVEARLSAPAVACKKPNAPMDLDLMDEMNLPAATTMSIDLLVEAIRCDRSRVFTLMLCAGTDIRQSSYLEGGSPGEHHALSHDAHFASAPVEGLAKINEWYGKQVADLLVKLNEVEDPETGATYLDNSLVFWGNEDGCNRQDSHWGASMPVLLAGSLGGHFKTGRYVDYRDVSGPDDALEGQNILYGSEGAPDKLTGADFRGRLWNSLLISILDGMGLEASEWETEGSPGYGSYGPNFGDQYSIADGQEPLPFLTG